MAIRRDSGHQKPYGTSGSSHAEAGRLATRPTRDHTSRDHTHAEAGRSATRPTFDALGVPLGRRDHTSRRADARDRLVVRRDSRAKEEVRLAERLELALHQMQQCCERDAGAPDGAVLGTDGVVSGDPRVCVAELQWV